LLMYQLARSGAEWISLSEIASVQKVSQGYLEQIVKPLRENGFVEGKRGFGGGYTLARPADQITVGEIIRVTEGPVVPVECVDENFSHCNCPDDCRAKLVWQKVGEAIDSVLDSITLTDLLEGNELK
jgi:Rrf2 family cysteine metabolism transcriptional repressor